MSKIDLHIHSKYSEDGELTTKEIVEKCRKQGIEIAAITTTTLSVVCRRRWQRRSGAGLYIWGENVQREIEK